MRGTAVVAGSVLVLAGALAGCRCGRAGTDAVPGTDSTIGVDSGPGTDGGGGGGLCDGITPEPGMPALGVEVVANFTLPVDIEAPPGDVTRLFVIEQPGRIRIVTMPGDSLLPTPFLNIESTVQNSGFPGDEEGLLGLAFHPDYATNGRFFVYYTENGGANNVVAEYTRSAGDPNVANTAGMVLLSIPNEQNNHNGGGMEFGPDGLLYIGSGDGGEQCDPDGDAQDPNSILGKILRLDVDAPAPFIPASNPFAAGGGRGEIFAYGFRNPWRLSFDRLNGDLYIGDVGQNDWEEVTVATIAAATGADYGWNNCEGLTPFNPICAGGTLDTCAGSIPPAVVYSHGEGCSVSGGYVYRGCRMPGWHGTYFYGDYCDGFVRSFVWNGSAATMTGDVAGVSGNVGGVSTFGVDARGELYVADLGGDVFRIVPN